MFPSAINQRVSSAEFVRSFAGWRAQSSRQPLIVTHHGRDAHVLLSREEFDRLAQSKGNAGARRASPGEPTFDALFDDLRDGIILINSDLQLVSMNKAARDAFRLTGDSPKGAGLDLIAPEIGGSHLHGHIVRMVQRGERYSGDTRSFARPGDWSHVQLIPFPHGGAIIFRDISDEMQASQASLALQAKCDGIEMDGQIGCAHLSPREAIENADSVVEKLLGIRVEAMRRARFSALIPKPARCQFVDAFETVLNGEGPVQISSALVANSGIVIPVKLSIVERRGAFANEGAVAVISPNNSPD